MKIKKPLLLTLILCVALVGSVFTQEKDKLIYATESGLGIQLSGEVEMEFIDVEGQGGFSHQDLTYQKVKTRSPHMRIDKAVFATKIIYNENLSYEIQFRYDDDDAYVDKHFATLKIPKINTVFEIGKNRPLVHMKRRTEGYPLIGTAFWKGREYHVTSNTAFALTENIKLIGGLSFAMKRPLASDDAAEDKSFKMLVYGDYQTKDGQTFEYGAVGGFEAYGLYGMGWYYSSKLIDDFDWKTQLSQTLAQYDLLGDRTDLTHWWYGGRVGFDRWNIRARAEYIESLDGLLPRDGYYAECSYRINVSSFLPIKNIEPLFRFGALTVRDHPELLGETATWDREMTTLALLTRINDNLTLKFEYYLLNEVTGAEPPDDSVKDNQFLTQISFGF
ncbi:hypothetical protein B6I21_05325 [candidate division KSB1 bacterium 4572_119]|nr:MAG: hypothetical protein B6I21_05325 [candidate division KSB1 bacterium 4572_119]